LSECPVKRLQVEIEKPVRTVAVPAAIGNAILHFRGSALDRCIHLSFPQLDFGKHPAGVLVPSHLAVTPSANRKGQGHYNVPAQSLFANPCSDFRSQGSKPVPRTSNQSLAFNVS